VADELFSGNFEWDEEKSDRCRSERGFDFYFAVKVFQSDAYAEWEEIGEVSDEIWAVVWTPRSNVRRIISARRASRQERKRLDGNGTNL
jgi:uncharacterized DUF497 family protein